MGGLQDRSRHASTRFNFSTSAIRILRSPRSGRISRLLKSWEKTKPTLGFPRQTDSLVPRLRQRSARSDHRRQKRLARSDAREGRRNQSPDRRTRRRNLDDQGLPDPRPLRRHDGHRRQIPRLDRKAVPRPRHSRPQRRRSPQARLRPPSATAAAPFLPSTSPIAAT